MRFPADFFSVEKTSNFLHLPFRCKLVAGAAPTLVLIRTRHNGSVSRLGGSSLFDVAVVAENLQVASTTLFQIITHALDSTHFSVAITSRTNAIERKTFRGATAFAFSSEDRPELITPLLIPPSTPLLSSARAFDFFNEAHTDR